MNIAEYFIRNKVISWLVFAILLVGGAVSFSGLGQLEYPEFPLPVAMVNTAYPGASPQQVEEEVTLVLERAIQELEYVKHIDSISSAGVSQITVNLYETYKGDAQPQIWDELRRKISDAQAELPPGVVTSQVNDSFSDVYGILMNISGDDYSYRELEDYANLLRRELSLVDGVKKVSMAGTVAEQVVIETSVSKMLALGLDPSWILGLIQNQNVVSNAGEMLISGNTVRIHPTGEFNDVSELERLLVSPPGSTELIYLGDIASIYKTYDETPLNLYRSNGEKAISFGIAFSSGVNVVDVGTAVDVRLAELESERPIGMTLTSVYDQPSLVQDSLNDFLLSLVQAVAIVIVVLLFTMGLRTGVLIGGILLLTVLGTFIGMSVLDIELQLISLGALIIALGMLVDNAIVVAEGVLVGQRRGLSRLEAIKLVLRQTQWPLLGATVIAIIAFAPIGLSSDATGDFLGSLFWVLMIALLLSWMLAITLTPFFCDLLYPEAPKSLVGDGEELYRGAFFTGYRYLLNKALRHRVTSLLLVLLALAAAGLGYGQVKQAFFPPSNTPMFFVDLWLPQGTDIRQTSQEISDLEHEIMELDGVTTVTSVMGSGAQRFVLTYSPENLFSSYGQLLINTQDLASIKQLIPQVERILDSRYPHMEYKIKLMSMGPSPKSTIEARFYGPEPEILRQLGAEAMAIMAQDPAAAAIRHSWRETVPVLRPQLDEAAARRSGISKHALDDALLMNFSGKQIGLYRDNSHLLPIIARAPESERLNADRISDLQVWSQEYDTYIPVSQVVSGFEVETENPLIVRRDLKRVLTVMTDVAPFSAQTAESLRLRLDEALSAMALPAGYSFEWGGEYETSNMAKESLFKSLPLGYLSMFLITVLLFGTIRPSLAIWFNVPLALIGVVAGLLLLDMPFTFTALLGLLSLSGMVVKNGIVLVEQITIENARAASVQQAIIDASVSRVRPVCMAALTTMLGMIPLLWNPFFSSMAVTIICGLGFATLLTLIVLPVTYSALHRIRFDRPFATSAAEAVPVAELLPERPTLVNVG